MEAHSRGHIILPLVASMTDVAELSKFAMKAGYTLNMWHNQLDDATASGFTMDLDREYDMWLSNELAWLTYLQAYTMGKSVRDVLAETEAHLQRWEAPLDTPPQDVAGIGDAATEDRPRPTGLSVAPRASPQP
jgi:hypothetical protein